MNAPANTHSPQSLPRASLFGSIGRRLAAVALALTGIGLILWLDSWFMQHADMPKLSRDMGYGLLFLIGFLTSFHCVGMCGPLIVGYTAREAAVGTKSYGSHFLYGVGKTFSYTAIGALFGAFGSIIAFTTATQGAVGIASEKYKDQGFVPIGIHETRPVEADERFRTFADLSYPMLIDEYRTVATRFGVVGLPTTLIVDEQGIVREKIIGEADADTFEKLLTTVLI